MLAFQKDIKYASISINKTFVGLAIFQRQILYKQLIKKNLRNLTIYNEVDDYDGNKINLLYLLEYLLYKRRHKIDELDLSVLDIQDKDIKYLCQSV